MSSGSGIGSGLRLDDVLTLTRQLAVRPLLDRILEVSRRIPGAGCTAIELLGADGSAVDTFGTTREDEPAVATTIHSGNRAFARLEVWPEDEAPLTDTALATVADLTRVAEVAMDNARAYADSERRRHWVQAAAELAETLHPPIRTETTLAAVAAGVRRVAAASFAAVLVPSVDGYDAPAMDGELPGERSGLFDRLEQELARARQSGTLVTVPHGEGTAAVLPVASESIPGMAVVLVCDLGRGRLIPYVRDLLASFADQAALAVDRASLLQERENAVVLADRERIGRDLHDVVVQRLFATGMRLQSTRHEQDPVDAQEHVEAAVKELELTIRHIRTTIYELQHGREASLRLEMGKLAREFAPALGFTPELRTWGPVDSLVPASLADHATAVVREALSNVARHADARACSVEVHVDGRTMSLEVTDDGRGLDGDRYESGLSNLRRRAQDLGGWLSLAPAEPQGTRLVWQVPLMIPERD